jgi:hypothetical protein
MTCTAIFPTRQLNIFLAAKDSFFKRNSQIVTQIGPTLAASAALGGRSAREKGLEKIINGTEASEITVETSSPGAIVHTRVPIAIVGAPLLLVAQNLIGFCDFNKTGFRSLLFIGIRVILLGETTISLFYLIIRRRTRYT